MAKNQCPNKCSSDAFGYVAKTFFKKMHRFARSVLNDMQFRCPNEGCGEVHSYGHMQNHLM